MDSGDTKAAYWTQLVEAYREKHPNIDLSYDPLTPNSMTEVVPLGVRNGTLHDLFQLPGGLMDEAVEEGWVMPLDDVIPNFEDWKRQYPEGILFEGVHIFDGKTYSFPGTAPNRYNECLLYSRQLMNDAGYDPEESPLTWDEYRDAAKSITEAGNGQVYGVTLEGGQPPKLVLWLEAFAQMGGGYGLNPATGEYDYASDAWTDALDLLLALQADGSLFPGSASMEAQQTTSRVVGGSVGMVTAGPWMIPQWEDENPDFDFGVGAHPHPGPGSLPRGYNPAINQDAMWVASSTENPEIAGDILAYHGSLEGATAWMSIVGPGNPTPFEEAHADAADALSPAGRRALELSETLVSLPSALIRNPEVAIANQEMPALTPGLGETIAGIIDGSITDVRSAMQDLEDRSDEQLDQAIAAARDKGANVSREDWVFSNFVPGEPYTPDMYDEL
ncbi:ABC transporter substrate-binding protein [Georgenia deserti]|uniref:ABC transporter substrate-binding protein n=1 Tax=Georgenia deserti TaxID=2093781 RepID=A0ABW4L424_9MICO